MTWTKAAVVGSLVMAAVSTLGDFIWATWIPHHRPVLGLSHGTLLFLAIGLYLGILARRPMRGALLGAALGFTAAGSFYVLTPFAGYAVMFFVWMGTWLGLSALHVHLQQARDTMTAVFVRGIVAAIAFTGAFYLVSGIWFPFSPAGWDYLWHFGAWTIAFLPGFAALFVANSTPRPATP
jgi:hypothetical protein